jgi:hypothetical protein
MAVTRASATQTLVAPRSTVNVDPCSRATRRARAHSLGAAAARTGIVGAEIRTARAQIVIQGLARAKANGKRLAGADNI